MKKNYFKKIAAIVAAASLCTASLFSVSAADEKAPIAYEVEDKTIYMSEITDDVVTLAFNFTSPAGKSFDSYGGFALDIETPDSITYVGRKDESNKGMKSQPLYEENPTAKQFIMSGSDAKLSNDSQLMTTLQFKIDKTKVKAGDMAKVRFMVTKNAMTSSSVTGDSYKGKENMLAFFEKAEEYEAAEAAKESVADIYAGYIKIEADPVETTTTVATTAATTAATTTAKVTTAATTAATTEASTTAASTTAATTSVAAGTTTTKATTTVPSSPKTGESTDGVAALAATIVAAAGAAVVLRKKKD